MRDIGDTSLANLPEPRSVEEVAAIAWAVDKEAERRYSALARQLRTLGTPTLAALLEELGGEHEARAGRLEAKAASGARRDIASKDPARFLPQAFSENGAAACELLGLTPYRVLAFAARLAQQSFELYSYLAAAADREVGGYAELLAGQELSRAASLRSKRRQAYHAGLRQPQAEAYPTAGLVETRADLLAAALAIEERLAQRLAEAGEKSAGLSSIYRATSQRVEELRRASEQAGESGGALAEELAKFSHAAWTATQADRGKTTAAGHLLAECDRAFTFYDAIARAPVDEAVLLQAQDLSRAAVERIQQVHAHADAADVTSRGGG